MCVCCYSTVTVTATLVDHSGGWGGRKQEWGNEEIHLGALLSTVECLGRKIG
jgi:hypothetical protein